MADYWLLNNIAKLQQLGWGSQGKERGEVRIYTIKNSVKYLRKGLGVRGVINTCLYKVGYEGSSLAFLCRDMSLLSLRGLRGF